MRKLEQKVAIAAYSELKPSRYPDRRAIDLMFDTVANLISQWQINKEMVDGVLVCPAGMASGRGADIFAHEAAYDALGIHPRFAETINAGGASYAIMVQRAALAIEAGQANAVLCIGAGKFPKVSAGGGEDMARMTSHEEFEFIYGTFIPAMYALTATRYLHDYHATTEDLARVAVSTREWALKNESAIMHDKGALAVEDVLSSRLIAEPFHLLDCSVPCEGGGALLVTNGVIAHRISPHPAYVLGMGEYHTHGFISQAPNFSTMGASISGQEAFEMAGIKPGQVDAAEIYDAFTINPLMYIEDLGFVEKGGGAQFFRDERGKPGGDLPVNTYGGLLSYGHTGDTSGISMITEAAAQVMGRAEAHQVPDADKVLIHTYGGMMCEHATLILGREV